MVNKEIQKKNWIIFVIGLIGITLFSIWKARYGFGGKDVSFYLTTPYRVTLGDKWFVDDWNLTQLSSMIIYPFVKLYITIIGSTEGTMISFRYLYIIVNLLITIYIYSKLKEFGIGAIIGMWMYFLFVPFNNMMLSYNTMGMMFGFVVCVIIAFNDNGSKIKYGFAGFFFAMTVLCQPLLAGVYIIVSIFILVFKHNALKEWLSFSVGCIIPAIPILGYAVVCVGLNKLIGNIPYMTMEMSVEHGFGGLYNLFRSVIQIMFPKYLFNIGGIKINTTYIFLLMYIVGVILILYFVMKKNRKTLYKNMLLTFLIYNVVYDLMVVITWRTNALNIILLPVIVGGLVCYIYGENTRLKKLVKLTALWGVAHIIGYLTSNGGMAVYSVALFPLSIISLIFVVYELKDEKIIVGISATILIVSLIIMRGCALFQDDSVFATNTKITYGPAKGIMVTSKQKDVYDNVWENAKKLDKSSDKVCILSAHTWMYLMMEKRTLEYGTYMPYTIDLVLENNGNYFKERNIYPEIIYIDNEYAQNMELEEILKKIGITKYKIQQMPEGIVINVE